MINLFAHFLYYLKYIFFLYLNIYYNTSILKSEEFEEFEDFEDISNLFLFFPFFNFMYIYTYFQIIII